MERLPLHEGNPMKMGGPDHHPRQNGHSTRPSHNTKHPLPPKPPQANPIRHSPQPPPPPQHQPPPPPPPPSAPSPPANGTKDEEPLDPNEPVLLRMTRPPLKAPRVGLEHLIPHERQWTFDEIDVFQSPSLKNGMSLADEQTLRAKGVSFIRAAGKKLGMPNSVLWVASVFFHRRFMRCAMVSSKESSEFHYEIAATALFMANKTEYMYRRTPDIVITVAKLRSKDPTEVIDNQSKSYWKWHDSIIRHETDMLTELTFDLTVWNPYEELKSMESDFPAIGNSPLRESITDYCRDATHTTIPLLLTAREVAISSIYYASLRTGVKLPDVNGVPWYKAVDANVELCEVAFNTINRFYMDLIPDPSQRPPQFHPPLDFENARAGDATPAYSADTARTPLSRVAEEGTAASPMKRRGSASVDGGVQKKARVDEE